MGSKREQNKEQKRQAMLDAAAKEFAVKSYYGTNCAQIAATARVAVGTIYEHYNDKQDLANKVYQRAYSRYLENFLSTVKEADSPERQYMQAWKCFHFLLETNRDEFLFTELQFHESYLDEASKTVRNMTRNVMGNWAAGMIAGKHFRNVQVETVFSLLIGSFTRMIKTKLETQMAIEKRDLDELASITWNCLRPD